MRSLDTIIALNTSRNGYIASNKIPFDQKNNVINLVGPTKMLADTLFDINIPFLKNDSKNSHWSLLTISII